MHLHQAGRATPGRHRHEHGRLTQPSRLKEVRKPAQPEPETLILMPDGGSIDAGEFHTLRSTSHMKLGEALAGCARRIRTTISREEWARIDIWMQQYRSRYRDPDRSSDNLMAVLLDYAGSRMKNRCGPSTVFALIMQDETAKVLLAMPATK